MAKFQNIQNVFSFSLYFQRVKIFPVRRCTGIVPNNRTVKVSGCLDLETSSTSSTATPTTSTLAVTPTLAPVSSTPVPTSVDESTTPGTTTSLNEFLHANVTSEFQNITTSTTLSSSLATTALPVSTTDATLETSTIPPNNASDYDGVVSSIFNRDLIIIISLASLSITLIICIITAAALYYLGCCCCKQRDSEDGVLSVNATPAHLSSGRRQWTVDDLDIVHLTPNTPPNSEIVSEMQTFVVSTSGARMLPVDPYLSSKMPRRPVPKPPMATPPPSRGATPPPAIPSVTSGHTYDEVDEVDGLSPGSSAASFRTAAHGAQSPTVEYGNVPPPFHPDLSGGPPAVPPKPRRRSPVRSKSPHYKVPVVRKVNSLVMETKF